MLCFPINSSPSQLTRFSKSLDPSLRHSVLKWIPRELMNESMSARSMTNSSTWRGAKRCSQWVTRCFIKSNFCKIFRVSKNFLAKNKRFETFPAQKNFEEVKPQPRGFKSVWQKARASLKVGTRLEARLIVCFTHRTPNFSYSNARIASTPLISGTWSATDTAFKLSPAARTLEPSSEENRFSNDLLRRTATYLSENFETSEMNLQKKNLKTHFEGVIGMWKWSRFLHGSRGKSNPKNAVVRYPSNRPIFLYSRISGFGRFAIAGI